jgi:uncharacterized protein (DUF433 family)
MTRMPGRIVVDPATCGGRPHFRGTRIPVYVVLEMLSNQESWEDIHRAYPDLRRKDLADALHFARELASTSPAPVHCARSHTRLLERAYLMTFLTFRRIVRAVHEREPRYSRGAPAAILLAAAALCGVYALAAFAAARSDGADRSAAVSPDFATLERRIADGQAAAGDWLAYGEALRRRDRPALAAEAFAATLRLDPYHREAQYRRAIALVAARRDDLLLEHMREVTLVNAKLAAETFARAEMRPYLARPQFAALAREARDQAND